MATVEHYTLREKQSAFVRLIGKLIDFVYANGYELTFGESYDDDGIGHMRNSLHYVRLAQDFNLFKDGVWLKKTEDFAPFGEYWEDMSRPGLNCCWGGRFGDGNHFSIEHGGRK